MPLRDRQSGIEWTLLLMGSEATTAKRGCLAEDESGEIFVQVHEYDPTAHRATLDLGVGVFWHPVALSASVLAGSVVSFRHGPSH
jgi:hypothetical protein